MTAAAIHVLSGPERAVALVVGGSRGIGADIVRLLTADHATVLTYHRHATRAERVVAEVNAAFHAAGGVIGRGRNGRGLNLADRSGLAKPERRGQGFKSDSNFRSPD